MENVKILFYGTERSRTQKTELEVFATSYKEIFIGIEEEENQYSFICLDKATSVRLVRELKKQIGFLMESEVGNG